MVELPNCYQGTLILLAMCYLNLKYLGKIFVSEAAHTETQDGKSELDAHFAKAMRFLIRFMLTFDEEDNVVKKISTPDCLALSLSCNGGMTNSIVQLVSFERETVLDQISKVLEAKSNEQTRCLFFSN